MMRQVLRIVVFSLCLPCASLPFLSIPSSEAFGQRRGVQLVSNQQASRAGLERKWAGQIELDPARTRLVGGMLHISSTDLETILELQHDNKSEFISEKHLDAYGKPYGIEGAKLAVSDKIETIKSRMPDADPPKVITHVVPRTTIYATTDRAVLHAIDAETGRTRWSVSVGSRDQPTTRPGANDSYVAVVNGTHISLYDTVKGELQWRRKTLGVPGGGPALSEEFVYVPTLDGAIESFSITDPKRPPWKYRGGGRAMIQPTVTPRTVSWATDRGFLYVASSISNTIKFRLEAQNAIVAKAAYMQPKFLFAASIDGYIYCVTEGNGDIFWRFSTGEPISHEPVAIGDAVYVVTDENNMFKVDAQSGEEVWWTRDVTKILALSGSRIYCLDSLSRIVVHEIESGGRVGMIPTTVDFAMTNIKSDRIYIGNRFGTFQCLKEIDSRYPYVHAAVEAAEEQPKDVKLGNDPQDQNLPNGNPNPFGGGNNNPNPNPNPFGGGGNNNPTPNPFGGGGNNNPTPNPFGGGGNNNPTPNPFGGGGNKNPDPFGGGNSDPDPFR